jgi:hypothetical protein
MEIFMAIECIDVRSGIIFNKVRFRATKNHQAIYGTLMGDKVFLVSKGEEFVLKMSKNEMWEKGDKARNFGGLITNFNQFKFNWYWADE